MLFLYSPYLSWLSTRMHKQYARTLLTRYTDSFQAWADKQVSTDIGTPKPAVCHFPLADLLRSIAPSCTERTRSTGQQAARQIA